ncbi:MAG: hypothetical protein HDQ88_12110 [Clostridia bacterium]|nr:hypothetical protein [Clostridia bacterium]
MNITQRIYEDAQAASGLQVGDLVKVIDCGLKVRDEWRNNSGIVWTEKKQSMIGNIFNITSISKNGIWDSNKHCFPYFALEKVSAPEHEPEPEPENKEHEFKPLIGCWLGILKIQAGNLIYSDVKKITVIIACQICGLTAFHTRATSICAELLICRRNNV